MQATEEQDLQALQQQNTQQGYIDYWGTDEEIKYYLPDGKQYFIIKVMNEGAKAKYQKMTNQDLVVSRAGDAKVKVDPARDRHELIKSSVHGWYMLRAGEEVPFSKGSPGSMLEQWLNVAPPKIVEDLEFAIRKANPWMQAEMTTAEIDTEVERLLELRKQVEDREAGERASANK